MSTSVPTALCGLLGLVSAGAVLLRTLDVRLGVRVLLPFLLAAVVLQVAGEPTWRELLVAAAVVGLHGLAVLTTAGRRPTP